MVAIDDGVQSVSGADLSMKVADFVTLSGSFAFQESQRQFHSDEWTHERTTTLANVNYLEVGGQVTSAFAGVGSLGFKLSDVGLRRGAGQRHEEYRDHDRRH